MKQGTILNKIVMLVLLAAILLYLGASAWRTLSDPLSTELSFAYTVDSTLETTGFLVREEVVLPGRDGILELLPQEGERVARQGTVALVYQSRDALDRKQELQSLILERDQLQHSLEQEDAIRDVSSLNKAVVDSMVQLRASTASGDLTGLEGQASELKTLVYRRDYIYGSDRGEEALSQALEQVKGQIRTLKAQSDQDTSRITAPCSGIFSGQVDGYESLLTPELLDTLTPTELAALASNRPEGDPSAVGKLITDSSWSFICVLPQADADKLYEGAAVTVRFSHDWSGQVEMSVVRIGEPENGKCAVVLTTNRFLSNVTLLRRQTVELVFGSYTGIRIPKEALRVEQRTVKDQETEQEKQIQINGVYALVGAQAEFKPVEVLLQEDDFCLVRPAPGSSLAEQRKALRAGDEIIVTGDDLFDGKVVK